MPAAGQYIKEGDYVLPGDRLGVIEEFIPGPGTFQGDDDVIYASIVGRVHIDMIERRISIRSPMDKPVYPRRNDVVIGEIDTVAKKAAMVNIFRIRKAFCPVPFSGSIYVKNATAGYVESMIDLFRPGDIVMARVLLQDNGIARLSTVGPRFGVIRAFCSRCGQTLVRRGNRLECPDCGNLERRKLSKGYGRILEMNRNAQGIHSQRRGGS